MLRRVSFAWATADQQRVLEYQGAGGEGARRESEGASRG
jgi:hypothetical protein